MPPTTTADAPDPHGGRPFLTVFGRGLVAELANFVHPPYLVVTMADLWPMFEGALAGRGLAGVYLVDTLELAELESAIYYCCREAIQNASKHGGPSVRISVFLHDDACSVGFEVSDDGPGFEVSTATGGGGLQHMRDRMLLLGGRLSIVSHAGVGTVVSGAISPG